MKQSALVGLVSFLSFVGGLAISPSSQAQKAPANQNNEPIARATSTPSPCPEPDEFPKLIDDSYVTTFNGARLNLDYDSGIASEYVTWAVNSSRITPLSNGNVLVNLGDTLYRLDGQRHVVWSYPTAQVIFDYAYVDSTNLIYATAGDNIMFILNATTGKAEFSDSRNGSAAFGVAEKYGNDMCLVTDNFVVYRERSRGDKFEPMKDGITCWRGTTILWHLDFPPDAELVVNGKRILAVTKSRKAIYVNEIIPPQIKSE
jgi:hypothetical protein